MCAHHEKEGQGHGYNNLTGVAWSILVMGLSLAAVIVLWVWFGYIGPTFSEDVLSNQQRTLREHFGLPVQEISDDPEVLQTPPSLRNIGQDLEANTSNNSATTTVTTTNATTNYTSKEGAGVQSETTAGGTTITIPSGASVQGNPDYEPDEAEVPLNGNIVWVNKDTVPHTATSGTGAEDPNSGKIFDTSIINGGEESSPVQITGVKEGDEIPYYCQVHPYMTSKLTVGAASAASAGGPTTASGPTAGNASSAGGAGGGNATTAPTTSTTAAPSAATTTTTAAAATLTIPQGASVQGNPAYEPDPLTVKVGDTIAVNNKDIAPHTVTNGKDATDPNMGKLFDTSIINAGDSAEIVTTGMKPGEYPYHCSVHPYMTGTMTVQ
jgi:plastocyanin